MKERILKLIKEIKERENLLLDLTYNTSGASNEYWLGKWSEVKNIREKLEVLLEDE